MIGYNGDPSFSSVRMNIDSETPMIKTELCYSNITAGIFYVSVFDDFTNDPEAGHKVGYGLSEQDAVTDLVELYEMGV